MEQFVTIYTFNYPHEAYVIKGRLESEGIVVLLKDEKTVQAYNFLSNAVGGVKLQVREGDVEEAIEILKEAGYELENETDDNVSFKWKPFIWRAIIIVILIMAALFVLYNYTT